MASTLYLVEPFAQTIVGAKTLVSGGARITGHHVVKVRDDTPIETPTDLSALLTSKEAGLLSSHSTYSYVLCDMLADPTTLMDVAYCNKASLGPYQVGLGPANGAYVTISSTLSTSPSQAAVFFDPYELTDTDPPTGRFERDYVEMPAATLSSKLQCYVSFDGSFPVTSVSNGEGFSVGTSGTDFRIRFVNIGTPQIRRYVGSWTLLYVLQAACFFTYAPSPGASRCTRR